MLICNPKGGCTLALGAHPPKRVAKATQNPPRVYTRKARLLIQLQALPQSGQSAFRNLVSTAVGTESAYFLKAGF